jgi:cation diffusion facilitator family transporter
VGALGGLASAVVLGESMMRLASPVTIRFDEAIGVAVHGLAVNLLCAFLLRDDHPHDHHDHNLRAAYLHVLADALTSVLAIVALVAGRSLGWTWMDPVMGIVGALVIARWSWGGRDPRPKHPSWVQRWGLRYCRSKWW